MAAAGARVCHPYPSQRGRGDQLAAARAAFGQELAESRAVRDRLQRIDLPLRDVDDAWDRLQRLRTVYGVQLQSLIDYLVAPAGFWGHSAELP